MANTKVTQHVIANNAITADQLASAAVTDAKLHGTLDLSGKTLTLPATAIPSASTATTQAASDNSTKLATTAYVTTAIGNLVDSAPTALDTLNELAAALGDDANFSATITTALGTKLPLAGGTLTGDLVLSGAPTSGLHPATKTYVDTADALKLNLSGGTLTGDLILNTTTALQIPVGTTGQRPTAATGQIRWNSTDGAIEVYNGTAWTAVGTGSSNKVLDTFTGDNSTTDFTLSVTPANEDALMVFIDGAYQEAGDYVLTNNVLALDTAPLTGEKISAHIITAAVHDGTSSVNNQFTATAGQTAFTLTQDPKSENNTQVYINGVYQQKTDYTVTGTTLAFDTGLTVGDVVEVNMFTVATLGNSDTVTEGVGNLYHTTARARGAISVSGNAISYNSSTGVLTANFEENPTFTGTLTSSHIISTSNTATQFKNATDSDIQHKLETNASSDFAIHRLIGSDGVDNKFIIGYGPNHGSTANHMALKNVHTSGSIGFNTGASSIERMRIISTGEVGIGTTPVAHYTGYEALDIGNTLSLMSNNTSTNISTLTNNGYLNSNASNWVRKVADESTMYEQVSGDHRFKSSVSGSAGGAITWLEKVRIQAAGGISFNGDTAAANALDDYEEGSWTPDIKRNDGSVSATFTVATGTATYVKIGRLVYVKAFINSVSDGSSNGSSYWRINGVPFAGKQYSGLLLGYNNTPADGVYIGDAGGNFILTVGAAPFYGTIGSNKEFMLAFTYETDS